MEGIVGRDFIYTNSTSSDLGAKKRTVGRRFFIGPKAMRFVAIAIFASLGILYLTQSTQGADRSYKVRDLTNQKADLTEQRDRLEIEQSRLKSLNEIDKAVTPVETQAQMQQTTSVQYLPNNEVAVR